MPTTDDATYRLCIYDSSGAAQPLFEADIPDGLGWRERSAGFSYKTTVGATLSGVTGVSFRSGTAGRARVKVTGKGTLLGPPPTDALVADVVVQLLIDDGVSVECFKTDFPGSGGTGAIAQQTSTHFKARGP